MSNYLIRQMRWRKTYSIRRINSTLKVLIVNLFQQPEQHYKRTRQILSKILSQAEEVLSTYPRFLVKITISLALAQLFCRLSAGTLQRTSLGSTQRLRVRWYKALLI